MSSTVTPTPSDGLTPSSTTQSSPSVATTEITNFFKDQKPLQSYLYPTLALIIAILVAVHACRFLERRRLRRRRELGRDTFDAGDDVVEEAVADKLVRPRMYEVYLDGKEAKKIGRDVGWNEIMPLASNVNVYVGDVGLAPSEPHPASQRQPWLAEDSRMNFQIIVDSIRGAVLSGLELLSLYNRQAERELRRTRNNDRHALALAASLIPEPPLDPNLPRELVTGVMILMPSVPRDRKSVV